MKAQETALNVLLEGQKQFIVPLFQRTYTWKEENWTTLWNDLIETYESGPGAQHFLGSIVTKALPGDPVAVAPFLVVDGQQRLATLTILLAALRDTARESDATLADKLNDLYLKNRYVSGLETYKVLPTQGDRSPYFAIIDPGSGDAGHSAIGAAYRFFRSKLSGLEGDGDAPSLQDLELTVLKGLEVVSITLGEDDNEYRIFESLNGTGQPLQQVDLLRNYLFMRIPLDRQEDVYTNVWLPMEQSFQGRQLEDFFRYEFMSGGDFVREGDVYKEWKKLLDKLSPGDLVDRLSAFAQRARLYRRIVAPQHEPSASLATAFARLNRWGGQTMYPFLLFAYDAHEADNLKTEDFAALVAMIESFLVRRLFAGVPTNALNRLFTRLRAQLPEGIPLLAATQAILSAPSRRWPRDAEFVEGILRYPLYTDSRPAQRKMILETLEADYGHKEAPPLEPLTIEHVMPQDLTEEWRADLGPDAEQIHTELLHVLGNLTLTGYNPELSNRPWAQKQGLLKQSNLGMNKEIAEELQWGRDEIADRARRLADRALRLWPGPAEVAEPAGQDTATTEPPSATQFASFYQQCIDRVQSTLDVELSRVNDTTFATPDRRIVIVCLVSREYENGWFWWTFRTRHQRALSTAPTGLLLLGCGSPDEVLSIPFSTWEPWLEHLNFTVYGEQFNWHVQVKRTNDRFLLHRKAVYSDVDVSAYLVR